MAEKIKIVEETKAPGCSVAQVARRYEMNANQLFAWRRQYEQGILGQRTRRGARLIRVQLGAAEPTRPTAAPEVATSEVRIEITLADGLRVALCGALAIEKLEQVLALLRR